MHIVFFSPWHYGTFSFGITHISLLLCSMFNHHLDNNPEQLKAVQHIVAGSSQPAPYVVFGPPGTGKTVTLVEAINQVFQSGFVRRRLEAKVLRSPVLG